MGSPSAPNYRPDGAENRPFSMGYTRARCLLVDSVCRYTIDSVTLDTMREPPTPAPVPAPRGKNTIDNYPLYARHSPSKGITTPDIFLYKLNFEKKYRY